MSTHRKPIPADLHPILAALIQARRDQNMSQYVLAERLHTTQGAVSRWESGRLAVSLVDLTRWAAVYGLTVFVAEPDALDGPIPELIAGGLA